MTDGDTVPRMKTRPFLFFFAAAAAALGLACGGSSGKPAGTVGGACFPNGTRDTGLTCFSNLCVDTHTDGGAGAGGASGSSGASGSGGSGGSSGSGGSGGGS